MSEELINGLIRRGREAGRTLADKFANLPANDAMSWEGHRWTRFRSGVAGLASVLIDFKRAAVDDAAGRQALERFLTTLDAPSCYQLRSESQRDAVEQATQKLLECAREMEALAGLAGCDNAMAQYGPFCEGPRPPVEVGSRAPI